MLFILFLSVFVVVFIDSCLKKKIFLCLVLACLLRRAFSCMAWHHKDQDPGADGLLWATPVCAQPFSWDDALSVPQTSLCPKDALVTWNVPKPSTEIWKQSYQNLWKPWFSLWRREWFSVDVRPDERITKMLQGDAESSCRERRNLAWLYGTLSDVLEKPLQGSHAKQKKGKSRVLLASSSTSCQQKCGRHVLVRQKISKGCGGRGKKAQLKALVPKNTKGQPPCPCKAGHVGQKKGQKKIHVCQKKRIRKEQVHKKKKAISVT